MDRTSFVPRFLSFPSRLRAKVSMARHPFEVAVTLAVSVSFVVWSVLFIRSTSVVAWDGRRYFCLFDDAMISLRYAWNFAHGNGLTYNAGERVEGYTNLLMTLLMAVPACFLSKSATVLWIQSCGVAVLLATAWIAARIADVVTPGEDHPSRSLIRVLAFTCTLSYYPLIYWSLMGMETGLLTLLVFLGVLFALRYDDDRRPKHMLYASVYLGLAYLTRNDSLVVSSVIGLFLAVGIVRRRGIRMEAHCLLQAAGVLSSFVLGQLLFRYLYYGATLPNTYTLKLGGTQLASRLPDGLIFIKPFLVEGSVLFAIAAIELLFGLRRQLALFAAFVASIAAYQVYIGGDAWNYWRFLVPMIPILAIVAILGLDAFTRAVFADLAVFADRNIGNYFLRNRFWTARRAHAVIVTGLMAATFFSLNERFAGEASLQMEPFQVPENHGLVNAALALREVTTANASVGVYWAGSIPYYTGRRGIDFLGKADRKIASMPPDPTGAVRLFGMSTLPGHSKCDLDYSIRTLRPTYVQYFQWGRQNLNEWAASTYVTTRYRGIALSLLRDSPDVLWEKLDKP